MRYSNWKWLAFSLVLLVNGQILMGQGNAEIVEIRNILQSQAELKHIPATDIEDVHISDYYVSQGITHAYLNQAIQGIPVYNSFINLHGKKEKWLSQFLIKRNRDNWNVDDGTYMDLLEIMQNLASQRSYDEINNLSLIDSPESKPSEVRFNVEGISNSPIIGRMYFVEYDKLHFRKAWQVIIDEASSGEWKQYLIDAKNGEVLEEINLTISCDHSAPCSHSHTEHNYSRSAMVDSSYNVFPWPLESPHAGGRQVEVKPWLDNAAASPDGWHKIGASNFQHTRGNNVDAYEDSNNSNGPTGGNAARADGGADLNFDFPWDVNGPLSNFTDAAVTNLFYWNNVCHDVWHNYGFDEASGNFQSINFSGNGSGGDFVRAEAQDGGGSCNANFATPPDGNNPRMQMYNCNNNGNSRDGSLDNLVIVHEYGHGISIRLTGGPATSGCLNNTEQMGEGWSDYFGLMMTIQSSDVGTDARGVGTWLFGQGPNGAGIRPHPYSTDLAINPMTYDIIKQSSISVPHGVGSVWATMIWEMTWALIDEHGFDPDIYNGTGGNNIAMSLVIEGLKIQPCSPGFVDGRDAILAADELLYGGANKCIIWEAFAKRGLGYSANQGQSSSRTDGTEAFDLPPECTVETSMWSTQKVSSPNEKIEYFVKVKNHLSTTVTSATLQSYVPDSTSFVSATNGASQSNGIIDWPSVDILSGDSIEYSFEVLVDPLKASNHYNFFDDVESGSNNWNLSHSGSTEFVVQSNQANSGNFAFFADDDTSPGEALLILKDSIAIDTNTILSFVHFYDTEDTWDGGRVFLELDNGNEVVDLGTHFTQNGYNSTVFNSIPAFSGNSGGFITSIVDLSSFAGRTGKVRFQMSCDITIGGLGWFIDDIQIQNAHHFVDNKVMLTTSTDQYESYVDSVCLIKSDTPFSLSFDVTDVSCGATDDGSINLTVSGGAGPFNYNWSSGQSTEDISGIAGGMYIVTVSSGSNSAIDSVRVLGGFESIVTDSLDNGGMENLRYLMETSPCPGDTIYFDETLTGDTILLNQRIRVGHNFTLKGLGANNMYINVQGMSNHFEIFPGRTLGIWDMNLINAERNPNGGAIYNKGSVILRNTILENNTENGVQKAFTNDGDVEIEGSTEIKE